MDESNFLKSTLKGVVIAILSTLMLLIILAITMTIVTLNDKLYDFLYFGLMILSLVVGTVVASRSNGAKGWLIGLAVGALFFVFTYMLTSIVVGEFKFDLTQMYKLVGNLFIGSIAGILGVNM